MSEAGTEDKDEPSPPDPRILNLVEWAQVRMLTDATFYGAMATSFPVVVDDLPEGILGLTNGSLIVIAKHRPQINKNNIMALLGHEINHIIFHHTRPNVVPSKPELWKVAQELEAEMYVPSTFGTINDILSKQAAHFKSQDLDSCDKIYLWLLKNSKKIPPIPVFDIVDYGGPEDEENKDGPASGGKGKGKQKIKIKIGTGKQAPIDLVISKVLQAQQMAEGMGSMPSNLIQKINDLRKPRVNWRSFLRQYWGTKVGVWDLEVTRFSPCYWNTLRIPVPPLTDTHGSPDVIIAIDTSGSMTGEPIRMVVSEIRGLAGVTSEVLVLMCDAEVQGTFKLRDITDDEILRLRDELRGGGGTDFCPVFEYIEKEKLKPQLLVFMTDTWGSYPQKVPTYPVVWLTPTQGDIQVPFGDLVQIPPEEYA